MEERIENPEVEQPEQSEQSEQAVEFSIDSLVELGIIPADATLTSVDDLVSHLDNYRDEYAKRKLEEFVSALPDKLSAALMHAMNTGEDLDGFLNFFQSVPNVPKEEEEQRKLIMQYLRNTTALSEAKISKMVQAMDEDELAEEAAKAYEEMLSQKRKYLEDVYRKREEERRKAEEENLRQMELLKKTLETSSLHPSRRSKLEDFIFRPRRTSDGTQKPAIAIVLEEISKNPNHFIELAEILLSYTPSKGFDLSSLERKVASSVTAKLKKSLPQADKSIRAAQSGPSSDAGAAFFENWLKSL